MKKYIKQLVSVANRLDTEGLTALANRIDNVIVSLAESQASAAKNTMKSLEKEYPEWMSQKTLTVEESLADKAKRVLKKNPKKGLAGAAAIAGIVALIASITGEGSGESEGLDTDLDVLKNLLSKSMENKNSENALKVAKYALEKVQSIRAKLGQPRYIINGEKMSVLVSLEKDLKQLAYDLSVGSK